MALTLEQLQLIKSEINSDPTLSSKPLTPDGSFEIAVELNKLAAPAFYVWKTDVPTKECKKAMVWTEYIARSSGEREAWQFMLSNGTINAADVNVRQGIADIFSGPGGAQTRTNLLAIGKRQATRCEKVLAGGTGSEASPATMSFEGLLSYQDVEAARRL